MSRRRSRLATLTELPPTLRLLVEAAERECPSGHADALLEFTALALRKVPSRGIFDPSTRDEHELFSLIEAAAQAHLNLSDARAAWQEALERASLPFDRRDAIETAALRVQTVSDTAYFYVGLAFGLAFMSFGRSS
ncbi:MAG: hypothetical protein LC791_08375 [Acidobacteria bacterium]|nr:hypothetical protein [Acidobacteriota bacterium]